MPNQIAIFKRRRLVALIGLGTGAMSVCFALLNSQQHLLAPSLNWPIGIAGIAILVIAQQRYRCPYCGKHPENGDVPMFDPSECAECGAKLK